MIKLNNQQGTLIVNSLQSLSRIKSSENNLVDSKQYQLSRLIYDVLTPALQNSLEIEIKINYKKNIRDFFEEKLPIIERHDHLKIVRNILNDYEVKNKSKFPNDLKIFSINNCCAIARNILNLKGNWKVDSLKNYQPSDLCNLGDVFNCSKLLKRHFFNRTNEFPINDAFFNDFMSYLDSLMNHLNINNHLKEIKNSILKTEIQLINERFKDISFVNAGNMSVTFKATDSKLKKIRMIKVKSLNKDILEKEKEYNDLIISVKHNYIIKYHEYITDHSWIYSLADFHQNGTLRDVFNLHKLNKKVLTNDEILSYANRITAAIWFLHRKKIIHNNINPENIYFENNEPKLGFINGKDELNDLQNYWSPEMFEKPGDLDEKVDIYAFGCLLYEMSELEVLFNVDSLHKTFDLDDKLSKSRLVKFLFKNDPNRFKILFLESKFRPSAKENLDLVTEALENTNSNKKAPEFRFEPSEFLPLSSQNSKFSSINLDLNKNISILISGSDDSTLKLWNLDTGKLINSFEGHQESVNCVELLPFNRIASGSDDKTIKIWSLENNFDPIDSFQIHDDSVLCLKYHNETLLSSSADKTVKIIDTNNYQLLASLIGHEDYVENIELISDNILATGSRDNTIRLWNIENIANNITLHAISVINAHTSNIKVLKRIGENKFISGSNDGSIKIWQLEGQCEISTIEGYGGCVQSVCCLSDTELVVTYSDHLILIWETNRKEPIILDNNAIPSENCLIKINDNKLACGFMNGFVVIYDLNQNYNRFYMDGNQGGNINDLIVVGDEFDRIASASNATIIVFNINDVQQLNRLEGHIDKVNCLKYAKI